MRAVFSVVFWAFLAVSCVVLFVVGLVVFLVTRPFDPDGRVQHLYSCFWAQLYFYVNPFWSLRVEGRERLPWRGAAVLVSNHESLGDILSLFGLYRPYKWVSKASVFKVPFLGWNMTLNRYVPLVRGDTASIARMMELCGRWLDRGVPVLLFPEGTRSQDGEVKAFKDGAFRLAVAKQCPVIPIAITGMQRALPKHGFVIRESAKCVVKVLEPVSPADFGGDVAKLREAVRERIIAAKRALDLELSGERTPPAPG